MQMKRFLFASALALSLGVSAQGSNYYVDATAKGGDGSAKAPFATIQQAADVAQAGGGYGHYAFNPGLYVDNDSRDFRFHHNVIWDVKTGIGWNQTSGYLEAHNNTIWARKGGGGINVTVAVPGCKIYNNLANQSIGGTGPASSLTNNLVVGGGFVGNPDKPASGLDFMLASNSPAINAGMVVPGVTDGAVGAPDVGAYEIGGPAWTAGAGTEPVASAAPIEFSATAMGAQGIRLGWTDVAFNEKAYLLERSSDGITAKYYAAGGGGGGSTIGNPGGPGGSGIGGSGSGANVAATDGAPCTGSGGGAVGEGKVAGGPSTSLRAGKGGSGIVIVRFVRTGN